METKQSNIPRPFLLALALAVAGFLIVWGGGQLKQNWLVVVGAVLVFCGWLLYMATLIKRWRQEPPWKKPITWQKAGLGLLFFCAIFFGIHWFALKSTPCTVAMTYVLQNEDISKELGPVKECKLPLFAQFSFHESSSRGEAEFNLWAEGSKGSGAVHVVLVKDAKGWKVISHTLAED